MYGHSTREAAKKLGVSWGTLNKFIALRQIPLPPLTHVGGVRVRLWSEDDIAKVREVLPKIQNGRKTRHKGTKEKQKSAPAGVPVPHKKKRTKKKK